MLAFLTPTPDAVSAWVEVFRAIWWQVVVPIATGLGGAWLWVIGQRRRAREERAKEAAEAARVAAEEAAARRREEEAAEARAAEERREREERRAAGRRLLAARARFYHAGADAARFILLQLYGPREERLSQEDQDARAAVLAHELFAARDGLWVAEGRRDPHTDPEGAAEDRAALRALTITRRFAPPFDPDDFDHADPAGDTE